MQAALDRLATKSTQKPVLASSRSLDEDLRILEEERRRLESQRLAGDDSISGRGRVAVWLRAYVCVYGQWIGVCRFFYAEVVTFRWLCARS